MNGSDFVRLLEDGVDLGLRESLIMHLQKSEREEVVMDAEKCPHITPFHGQAFCCSLESRPALEDRYHGVVTAVISDYLVDVLGVDPSVCHITHLETVVQRHKEGGGEPMPHFQNYLREPGICLGLVGYLNDCEVGGTTRLPFQGLDLASKEGQLAIFPLLPTYFHYGPEPKKGDKMLVVTFVQLGIAEEPDVRQ